MTDEELAAIRERLNAATPGEWVADDVEPWYVFETTFNGEIAEALIRVKRAADTAFIAHAHQDVPALLAEVERLRAREAAMREIVEAVANFNDHEQWATLGDGSRARYRNYCEWCDGVPIEDAVFARLAHTADCPVIKARALLGLETE